MKTLKIALFLFLLSNIRLSGQENIKQALIVVHVDAQSKGDFKQKIYAYHFLNGHFTGREELLSVNGKQGGKDYIRTDLGSCTIYKDRYMITGIGNIIDLKDKKVLFDGRAKLIKCSNDSAIFYTNDIFKGKFYSVYNFKTNQYGEVKNLTFKAKVGQDVEFDKTVQPFKLFLYPANKPKVELVKDAGYGQSGTDQKNPDPPMWWIDNSNFVYTNFNKENTEISFYKVNADSKNQTLLGKLPFKPNSAPGAVTAINKDLYMISFNDKAISVNVADSKVEDLAFTIPTDGFCAEIKAGGAGRRVLQTNNKELGKYHFQLKNFKSTGKTVALVKEINLGTESYQQGMAVWNFDKQKFENVDAEDVLTLVGWIKE